MKRVFKKCFLTLILAFIRGYQTKEHNDFFHELYFELVLIIIEKASTICEKVSVEPKKT